MLRDVRRRRTSPAGGFSRSAATARSTARPEVRALGFAVTRSYAAPAPFLLIIVLLVSQLSCGDRVGKAALPPEEKSVVRTASAKATVDIFLDASDSMSGFLVESTDGPKNYYRDVLGRLADVIKARANTDVHQWRFGKGAPRELGTEASGRSFRDFVQRPSLFNDSRTDIDEVLRAAGTKVTEGAHVKILVTDLFQNAGDVGKLANEFNERYLKVRRTPSSFLESAARSAGRSRIFA